VASKRFPLSDEWLAQFRFAWISRRAIEQEFAEPMFGFA
jgi:hypothetical protein